MKKVFYYIISGCVSILFPTFLCVVICFALYMTPSYFIRFNERQEVPVEEELGLTKAEVDRAITSMIQYTSGTIADAQVMIQTESGSEAFYNERELSHMKDIRVLYQNGRYVVFGVLGVCVVMLVYLVTKKQLRLLARTFLPAQAIEVLLLAACGLVFVYEPFLFIKGLHRIFFSGDSWLFDWSSDRIIYFFPDTLYADLIIRVCVVYGIILALFAGLSVYMLRAKPKAPRR